MKDRELGHHNQRASGDASFKVAATHYNQNDFIPADNGRYQQSACYELRAEDL